MRYAGKRRDAVLGTRHGHILIETDVVPQMKPIPAAAFGKPAAVAETAPYFGGTERSSGPVQFRIARIGLTARKHPHLERCRILLQLYPYPAADNRPVVGHCFRFPAGTDSGVRRRLLTHDNAANETTPKTNIYNSSQCKTLIRSFESRPLYRPDIPIAIQVPWHTAKEPVSHNSFIHIGCRHLFTNDALSV